MAKAILFVEDSHDDVVFLKRALDLAGVIDPVCVVEDGIEAIAYLSGEGVYADRDLYPMPAVIFLDLKLPKRSGFEVLEWIRDRPGLGRILLVVITEYSDIFNLRRAYALGAHSFLAKPITKVDLKNLISHYAEYWTRLPSPGSISRSEEAPLTDSWPPTSGLL